MAAAGVDHGDARRVLRGLGQVHFLVPRQQHVEFRLHHSTGVDVGDVDRPARARHLIDHRLGLSGGGAGRRGRKRQRRQRNGQRKHRWRRRPGRGGGPRDRARRHRRNGRRLPRGVGVHVDQPHHHPENDGDCEARRCPQPGPRTAGWFGRLIAGGRHGPALRIDLRPVLGERFGRRRIRRHRRGGVAGPGGRAACVGRVGVALVRVSVGIGGVRG